MCISIVCFPGCNIINVEINSIYLIKPFPYKAKSQVKNLNILKTKGASKVKQKTFFIIFKELSVDKIYLKP